MSRLALGPGGTNDGTKPTLLPPAWEALPASVSLTAPKASTPVLLALSAVDTQLETPSWPMPDTVLSWEVSNDANPESTKIFN